jgi:hypothetical protein
MKPRTLYLVLCVAGLILPQLQLLPVVREHGLDFQLLFDRAAATGFRGPNAVEVLVSTVGLWTLVLVEGRRARMRHLWIPMAASLAVGVGLGLPLFLYMRETRLQRSMWSGGRCEV